MNDLALRLARLPIERRRALEQLLARQAAPAAPGPPPIPRRGSSADAAPLSFAQERLWFLQQLDPDSRVYNTRDAIELSGALDVRALRVALTTVIARHEILRTVIRPIASGVAQIVLPPGPIALSFVDLEALPASRREAAALRETGRLGDRPFDLAAAPARRLALYRLRPDWHLLGLATHHILDDGWSSGVLLDELTIAYAATVRGETPVLPELPIQYADYAAWHREWIGGERGDAQLAYWRRVLADLSPLDLPLDRPRPAVRSDKGLRTPIHLPADTVSRAQAIGHAEQATLFMVMVTALFLLLHRASGQRDLAIGTPIANRGRLELERLIGLFANTIVLRVDWSGALTFRTALRRVRDVCLGAYAHQDLPFERLVEALQPHRELNRHPLVQAVFVLQAEDSAGSESSGLRLRRREAPSATTPFDIVCSLRPSAAGADGFLQCSRDLFDPETGARLATHFVRLLTAALDTPDRLVSELPMLTDDERRQATAVAPAAASTRHPVRLLTEWFKASAARTPEAIALRCDGQSMTYRELQIAAERLARDLRQLGIEPDMRIALCLERSFALVIAILAVLDAGGAYVPLDPDAPKARLHFMIEDAGAPIVITQESLRERLPEIAGRIVSIDAAANSDVAAEGDAAADADATPRPVTFVRPDHLAYVIYTSGSTGEPKGVAVTHANASRLLTATERRFAFTGDDVWSLAHSYAFDFSVWEIWGALAYGGTLVIVPQWIVRSPENFCDLLRRERVTVLNQTPSAFLPLMRAALASPDGLPDLRYIIFGGEALDFAALSPWCARVGDERPALINMYGITETTVHVTWHRITRDQTRDGAPSRIGEALDDLGLLLLDRHLEPVPRGATGELHVSGAGLARGYLGRPGLTASRFVPDPWSGTPGARLYRAGDLARQTNAGEIAFLGRDDGQVKIRGFRIECGEIERVVERFPTVVRCVVLPVPGPDGEPALAAFIVCDADVPPPVAELRGWLRKRVMDYLVPSSFHLLPALPLTANGKLDRAALLALAASATPGTPEAADIPSSLVEVAIAEIWKELLRTPRAHLDENFFDVGGHSLLAAQFIARVRAELGVDVALRAFFGAPTLRELAQLVEQSLRDAAEAGDVSDAIDADVSDATVVAGAADAADTVPAPVGARAAAAAGGAQA